MRTVLYQYSASISLNIIYLAMFQQGHQRELVAFATREHGLLTRVIIRIRALFQPSFFFT
jgi:hypothetical protein